MVQAGSASINAGPGAQADNVRFQLRVQQTEEEQCRLPFESVGVGRQSCIETSYSRLMV